MTEPYPSCHCQVPRSCHAWVEGRPPKGGAASRCRHYLKKSPSSAETVARGLSTDRSGRKTGSGVALAAGAAAAVGAEALKAAGAASVARSVAEG